MAFSNMWKLHWGLVIATIPAAFGITTPDCGISEVGKPPSGTGGSNQIAEQPFNNIGTEANLICACCDLCREKFTEGCRVYSWTITPSGNGNCKVFQSYDTLSGASWKTQTKVEDDDNICPCPLGCAGGVADPHFVTLDGLSTSVLSQSLVDSSNPRFPARYLLLRTVACSTPEAIQSDTFGYPLMNVMYEPEVGPRNRSYIHAILADFNFKPLFGDLGKHFQLRLEKAGRLIQVTVKVDGMPFSLKFTSQDGQQDICALHSLDGTECRKGSAKLSVGLMNHGQKAYVDLSPYNISLHFTTGRRFHLDIPATAASQSLSGNLMGLLGNFNGDPADDPRCPDLGEADMTYSDCWMVTSDGKRLAPKLKRGSKFYDCTKTVMVPYKH